MILSKRITAGGNEVYEASCTDGQSRTLLTDLKYWANEAVRS